jgi:transcriptional regulator with XRE-family HTH domain
MHIAENLKKLIKKYNLNTLELSRETGIGQPVIYQIVAGKTNNPKLETVYTLAKYFGITVNDLIEAESQSSSDSSSSRYSIYAIPLLLHKQLNILPNMGKANEIAKEKIQIDFKPKPLFYALAVWDNSMEPIFPKGSVVIVDGDKLPQDFDYVVVKLGEEIFLRQILIDNHLQYLTPLNIGKTYKVMLFDNKIGKFLGVVIQSRVNFK